jgi:hypothetical protein
MGKRELFKWDSGGGGDGGSVSILRRIIAGLGLYGGGDLSSDVTIDAGEGPGIDITADAIGLGGDTILLYDDSGLPVAEYSTITLALAAAATGNLVLTPPGLFTEDFTVPAGVGLRSIVAGTITLGGNNSFLKEITLALTANSASTIIGVIGPPSGEAIINDCSFLITNNGAGNAYAIQMDDGDLQILHCDCRSISVGGDGFGVFWDGDGRASIRGGRVNGSTLDFKGTGSTITGWYFPSDFDDWDAYEWAYAGGAFSTQSWNDAHGYSALGCIHADTEPAPEDPNQRYSGIQFTPGAPITVNTGDQLSAWMYKISEVLAGPGIETNVNRIRINFTDTTYTDSEILQGVGIWNQIILTIEAIDDGKVISNLQIYGISNSESTAEWYIDNVILITTSSGMINLSLSAVELSQAQPSSPSVAIDEWSDRSAWDALTYQNRHANDINNGIHWTLDELLDLAGGTSDASDVTYTPAEDTDWDGDADPGNADDAFDQLAERVDDLENEIPNNMYIDQAGGTADTYGILAGARNGANTTFTVSQGAYTTGTLTVYLNGQLLTQGSAEDWVETTPASGTFDFAVAPEATEEITVVYGYLGYGGVSRRIYSELCLQRNAQYGVVSPVGATWAWGGDCLSSSTGRMRFDLLTDAILIHAKLLFEWTPNAPGAPKSGVRLVHMDDGPTNITEIWAVESNTMTPIVSSYDVTADIQALITAGVDKQLGFQVHGDGTNSCTIYGAILEFVWG